MGERVAVIGATGFLGQRLVPLLINSGRQVTMIARHSPPVLPAGATFVACDARDGATLTRAVADAHVLVNAACGPPAGIEQIARTVRYACTHATRRRLVHVSSLAVFGQRRGMLHEDTMPTATLFHPYARSKRLAEVILTGDTALKPRCVILRPGCMYGPGAPVWSDRIGRLLLAGRLGWLGPAGAGWCSAIHVADVARAIVCALDMAHSATGIHHILAPDELTWNGYFKRFGAALAIKHVKQVGGLQLAVESCVIGPALHLQERLSGLNEDRLTPSMCRLFRNRAMPLSRRPPLLEPDEFTPLEEGLTEAAASLLKRTSANLPQSRLVPALMESP